MVVTSKRGAKTVPSRNDAHIKSDISDFRQLADSSPGIIDVYDYSSGRYVYVNRAMEHILGYEPQELLAGGLDFIIARIHPDDIKQSVVKNIAASKIVAAKGPNVDDSKPFVRFEYRVRHKDGHWVWLHTDASVFARLKNGSLKYVINTCVDITEQKTAETKLRELSKKLNASRSKLRADREQLVRLNNAKDDFISIASHQLRTPSTGVKQYIGMLIDGYAGELNEQQAAMLKIVYESNEWQLKLINDLLKIIQIDGGEVKLNKVKFDLVRLMSDIKDEVQKRFSALEQELVIRSDNTPVDIIADEGFIRMAAENLIDNASKYSERGRSVDVTISKEDHYAVFSVKDQGIGMSREDQKKLYQKFSRVTNPRTTAIAGTGLGLYWAKKIIDLHGGNITVLSRRGEGTTFTVRLPLA